MRTARSCRSPHGTNARYLAGCSCLPCCDAHAAYQRERKAEIAAGTWRGWVDTETVREHVAYLKNVQGLSLRAIGEMAGVGRTSVYTIWRREREHCTAEVADALLALRGHVLTPSSTAYVSNSRVQRTIDGLRRRGHSLDAIAQACGVSRQSLPQPGQRHVQARVAHRILEASKRLRGSRGCEVRDA